MACFLFISTLAAQVLDYVRSLKTDQELVALHRQVIQTFSDNRPPGTKGWSAIDVHPMACYVVNEIHHHLRAVMVGFEDAVSDPQFLSWLDSSPSDRLTEAVAQSFPPADREKLPQLALDAGDGWIAFTRMYAIARAYKADATDEALAQSSEYAMKTFHLWESLQPGPGVDQRTIDLHGIKIYFHGMQTSCVPLLNKMKPRLHGPDGLIMSEATQDAPMVSASMSIVGALFMALGDPVRRPKSRQSLSISVPLRSCGLIPDRGYFQANDMDTVQNIAVKACQSMFLTMSTLAVQSPDKLVQAEARLCMVMCDAFAYDMWLLADDFDTEIYFPLEDYKRTCETYDYDRTHPAMLEASGSDIFGVYPCALPIALQYGDMGTFMELMNTYVRQLNFFLADHGFWNINSIYQAVAIAGNLFWMKEAGVVEQARKIFGFLGCSVWDTIGTTVDSHGQMLQWAAGRGECDAAAMMAQGLDPPFSSLDAIEWALRLQYVQVMEEADLPSAAEFLAMLPPPQKLVDNWPKWPAGRICSVIGFSNPLMHAALACERLELHAEALPYITGVIDGDLSTGGSFFPRVKIFTNQCKGRCLAALGRAAEAQPAFEAAAALASEHGLLLMHASVLIDQVRCLPDSGAGEKLTPVLGAMIGPTEALATRFGDVVFEYSADGEAAKERAQSDTAGQ